ncbi:hypothetical protein [Phascolarctobacterium sp.]|uniref:hypothetical protein n=1 Tax=Phascolarctobacterium sp. TaxID=2049039 RepID=UPI0038654589
MKTNRNRQKRKQERQELANGRVRSKNPYIDLQDSGGGRPIKLISELGMELIEKLAGLMCTDEEIAAMMSDQHERISVDTLTNENNGKTFAECKEKGQAQGKASLRRNQFKLSESSAAMAIFLGKNWLGQTDKQEVKTELSGDGSIVFNIMPASQRPPEDDEEEE